MRYDAQRKDRTRQLIVKTAAKRFRAEGIAPVGVANLMSTAGFTHGGFYAHFTSKEELVIETCRAAFGETLAYLSGAINAAPPGSRLRAMLDAYLSVVHRDNPSKGCFAAALITEAARSSSPVREALTECIGALVVLARDAIRADGLDQDPKAVIATMIGALAISRVIKDSQLSKKYLAAGRQIQNRTGHRVDHADRRRRRRGARTSAQVQ
jgi:TetR/AcrR family transcriptional regulator, transcriptional repressor for nem operon